MRAPLLLADLGNPCEDRDALLLALLSPASRETDDAPNERRPTLESPASLADEAVEVCDVRFLLLLIVMLFVPRCPSALVVRGLDCGGVLGGGGSLDRAE